ncbi:MAG: hypothetical protein WCO71_00580 [Pseudomonadota bacterium]
MDALITVARGLASQWAEPRVDYQAITDLYTGQESGGLIEISRPDSLSDCKSRRKGNFSDNVLAIYVLTKILAIFSSVNHKRSLDLKHLRQIPPRDQKLSDLTQLVETEGKRKPV